MPSRKVGRILSEHEAKLVEAGLDEDLAAALVDELEDELDTLEEEDAEGGTNEEEETEEEGQ